MLLEEVQVERHQRDKRDGGGGTKEKGKANGRRVQKVD